MSRERVMALLFAAGSACFLVGPFPGYAQLVGATAVGVTFFAGSILFTGGGAMQTWLASADRRSPGPGGAAWGAALVQSAGTLFFNVTTLHSLSTLPDNAGYDRLVWRPDALGSICFLVSGVVAYRAAARRGGGAGRGGGDRLPGRAAAWLAAGPRRSGLVGARRQPARLHPVRHLGRRRLPGAGE